jgi:hypothetical protein
MMGGEMLILAKFQRRSLNPKRKHRNLIQRQQRMRKTRKTISRKMDSTSLTRTLYLTNMRTNLTKSCRPAKKQVDCWHQSASKTKTSQTRMLV